MQYSNRDVLSAKKKKGGRSVIRIAFHPTSISLNLTSQGIFLRIRGSAHDQFSQFIIGEYPQRKWNGGEPVSSADGTSPNPDVDNGDVAKETGKKGLKNQTEVHEGIQHALMTDGVHAGLANHQVGPLHNDNGNEVSCLRVGQGFLLQISAQHIGLDARLVFVA